MLRKKIIISLACFALISSVLTGCQNAKNNNTDSNKEKIENNIEKNESNKADNIDNSKVDSENKSDNKNDQKSGEVDILYYTYDINTEDLKENKTKVKELTVENIVNELIKQGVLQEGTSVNKAKVEYIDDVKTLSVDMNNKFINFDLGSSAETLMLQAFTNSLIKSFNVNQLNLTIDGENYSSGHIVLDDGQFLKFK